MFLVFTKKYKHSVLARTFEFDLNLYCMQQRIVAWQLLLLTNTFKFKKTGLYNTITLKDGAIYCTF